jgi:hypothetical protein
VLQLSGSLAGDVKESRNGNPTRDLQMAIENSLRVAGGGGPIQQFLPDLYQTIYPSGSYATDFHDITTGSSGGICVAGHGYDYVTGVGTPIANHLANDLIHLP